MKQKKKGNGTNSKKEWNPMTKPFKEEKVMEKSKSSTKPSWDSKNGKDSKKSRAIRSALCTNDVEWYMHYETLSSDTSKLFMSRPNGLDYPGSRPLLSVDRSVDLEVNEGAEYIKQGGICALDIIPMYGGNFEYWKPNTPLNNAASKLYYYIVHGNSRNISYDKSDLMRCIIAFDNIQMLIEEAKRAYRLAKNIKVSNRWDKMLLTAAGWDYNDITDNLVNFRTQINLAIQKFNQISIPEVFDIFKSHREMVSWIYRDRLDEKCQYIMNRPRGYWVYDDEHACLDLFTSGRLNSVNVGNWGTANTVRGFTTLVNYMLHTVYDSTDMGVMQGDIKRAFADTSLITIDMLVDDDFIPIVYDEEFNLKVHNLEFANLPNTKTITLTLETDTSYTTVGVMRDTDTVNGNLMCMLLAQPTEWDGCNRLKEHVHIMDMPDSLKDDVKEIIIAQTRKCESTTGSMVYFVDDPAGSETDVEFYDCLDSLTISGWYYFNPSNFGDYVHMRNALVVSPADQIYLPKLSEMDVTPRCLYYRTDDATHVSIIPPVWEVNNVTVYSQEVLKNMLNVMTESLFYNPLLYNKA